MEFSSEITYLTTFHINRQHEQLMEKRICFCVRFVSDVTPRFIAYVNCIAGVPTLTEWENTNRSPFTHYIVSFLSFDLTAGLIQTDPGNVFLFDRKTLRSWLKITESGIPVDFGRDKYAQIPLPPTDTHHPSTWNVFFSNVRLVARFTNAVSGVWVLSWGYFRSWEWEY